MNDAELYRSACGLQRRDAEQAVEEFSHLVGWRTCGGDASLDVGCGDGRVLMDVLVPKLMPPGHGPVTGVDVSAEMVRCASSSYGGPNVDFQVMDISRSVAEEWHQRFDHVFSFYCLHWVQDQRTAMRNIYNMLKPGGDCLITIGANNPIYDVYRYLRKNPKWAPYKKDLDRFISPYHDSYRPAEELENLLLSTGFNNVYVECKQRVYYYNHLQNLKKSMFAVNPFIKRMPSEMHEEYFEDYIKLVKELDLIEEDNNNIGDNVRIKAPYSILIAHAVK